MQCNVESLMPINYKMLGWLSDWTYSKSTCGANNMNYFFDISLKIHRNNFLICMKNIFNQRGEKVNIYLKCVFSLIFILVVIGIDLKVGISLLGTFVSNFSMQTHLHIASTTNATDVVFYESVLLLQCCVKSVRTQATSLISISL